MHDQVGYPQGMHRVIHRLPTRYAQVNDGTPPPSEADDCANVYASLKKKLPIFINIAEGKT